MSSEIVAQKTKATAHTNTITPEEPQKKLGKFLYIYISSKRIGIK
jgi:hypothetical protein